MCFTYFSIYGMMVIVQLLAIKLLQSFSSFCTSFWNLFSGFLIPRPLIPVWWMWYYWGSPIAWTIYGIFASPFGDLKTVIDTPKGPQRVDLFLKDNLGYEYDFVIPVFFAHIGLDNFFLLLCIINFILGYLIKSLVICSF
ncbi:unnamed protein product [Prunus brigantina]